MIHGIDILRKKYPAFDEENYQPAGIDLNVGMIYTINQSAEIGIVHGHKMSAPLEELDFVEKYYNVVAGINSVYDDVWRLEPGFSYIFEVDRPIKISEDSCQFYLPRSTLLRNSISVQTALGDNGYNGRLRFLVINHNEIAPFYISKGERFAQLIDFEVDGWNESYDGDYQEEEN